MGSSMKDYLQKYLGNGDNAGGTKVKSKKPKRSRKDAGLLASRGSNSGPGIIIVDHDASWQKEQKPEDEEDEPEGEGDAPLVIEDVEVKRMQRMELMRMHRPYLSVANDGSGWVTVKGDELDAGTGDGRLENVMEGLSSLLPRRISSDAPARMKRSDSPDSSPPRRRHRSPQVSHGRQEATEDHFDDRKRKFLVEDLGSEGMELSPPRQRVNSMELSPQRKGWDPRLFSTERRGRDSPVTTSERRRHDTPPVSPSNKMKHDSPTLPSRRKRRHDSPSSPARKTRHDSATPSSRRRRRHDSPSLSPSLKRRDSPSKNAGPVDLSPPRRRRNSPSKNAGPVDLSPPRRRRDSSSMNAVPVDLSPPRRRRDSPSKSTGPVDLSPPRRRSDSSLKNAVPVDLSPPRRRRDFPSEKTGFADLSPPRRRRDTPSQNAAFDDLSPPRKNRVSTVSLEGKELASLSSGRGTRSPPRKRRHDSPDMSIRGQANSADPSSPRNSKFSMDSSPPRKSKSSAATAATLSQSGDLSPARKKITSRMSDGTVGGLKSVRDVASDAERIKAAQAKLLSELDPSQSGRGAETVFRDKRGRRLEGLEELMRQQKGGGKPAEQPLEWGKGLAQKKIADTAVAELEAEKEKPFARYRDDAELDRALKEVVRFGDPMAHLVKKKTTEPVLEDLGAREEMKASGFIIPQDIPKHSWIKTGATVPPNRYGIKPGRHWDGVDRSTGFERDLFKQKNEKKAREQEAYLWSVADM